MMLWDLVLGEAVQAKYRGEPIGEFLLMIAMFTGFWDKQ